MITHRRDVAMIRYFRGIPGSLVVCSVWLLCLCLTASRAGAEDVYFKRAVADLVPGDAPLPDDPMPSDGSFTRNWGIQAATVPYVVIDGKGEAYLDNSGDGAANRGWIDPRLRVSRTTLVAFLLPDARAVSGRLFVLRRDGKGMGEIAFKVAAPAAQDDAKAAFALAKRHHYERLLARDLPGTEWFQHQLREADGLGSANRRRNLGRGRGTELEQTFDLFSGARAVDENLQLDRAVMEAPISNNVVPRPNAAATEPRAAPKRVATADLKGITVAEMDWSAKLKDRTPALDPLATRVPADQHAIFLPGFKAAAALLSEFHGDAIPLLRLAEARSEDTQIQRRYERQLGVSLAEVMRFPGLGLVKGLVLTGSDPYFPSGTDLAILVETDAPEVLAVFLKAHLEIARKGNPDAVDAGGEIGGVRYAGARSPDRSLSAYIAILGKSVVLTNSPAQLARLIDADQGKTPALSGLPEYKFFRDRYARADDGDSSAFLVLTDATIRRWCGPRWRIGSSRRVRAARALAEMQTESIAPIVESRVDNSYPKTPPDSIDLGALHLGRSGVRSEAYGTLAFQTPIAELALDEVEQIEANAYSRWRDGYQSNWRGVFDPIAARLSFRPDRLSADLTVMPLIGNSEYKTYMDLVGSAKIAADAGDRHEGTLGHAIMALDKKSSLFVQGSGLVANFTHLSQQVALGWLGDSVSLYLDDDAFWGELATAENRGEFLVKKGYAIPLAVQAEVTDGTKLALFLAGLRAFVDQSAPNLTVWENREHQGRRYVRVTEAGGGPPGVDRAKLVLYYYASPRSLTLSPNEEVIKRAIDRKEGKGQPGRKPRTWLGQSLALRVAPRGLEVFGSSMRSDYRDEMQVRSWSNLPILNEWKRLFPDRDPVAVHEAVWGTTLVDPGGGRYTWNARWATMESTVFGHPGEPRVGPGIALPTDRFGSLGLGLDFEDRGLRARTEVELKTRGR
jgi:hypothetical protein